MASKKARSAARALKRAIESAGTQQNLAEKLGVTYQAIQKWLKQGVPAERVLELEAATGVSRHDLRPDLYPRESLLDRSAREPAPAA